MGGRPRTRDGRRSDPPEWHSPGGASKVSRAICLPDALSLRRGPKPPEHVADLQVFIFLTDGLQ